MNKIYRFTRIGLGTVQLGTSYGIANKSGQPDLEEANSILKKASELGIDLLDTAGAYGQSEETLGKLDGGRFQIVSKWADSPEQLADSLKKLNVSALYGWLAHRADDLISHPSQWEEMQTQQQDGKVNKIGYSLYNVQQLDKLLELDMIPSLVQIPFNVLDKRFVHYFDQLKSLGCEIHCRSIYLQGLFFMKPQELDDFFKPVKDWLSTLHSTIPDKQSLVNSLLNGILSYNAIDKIIIGVDNHHQLGDMELALTKGQKLDIPEVPELPEQIINPALWPLRK